MKTAERIYRVLLRLYPQEHREAYGQEMLQHARDLELDARERGRLYFAALYLRLIIDGILNAGKEHWAVISRVIARVMRAGSFEPVPWPAVLMAAIPGLLMALSRRHAGIFGPALNVLGVVYIALFALIPPIMLWRRRAGSAWRFPVWALLPLGILAWTLTFLAGTSLSSLATRPGAVPGLHMTATTILNGILVVIIFYTMLHGDRIPKTALAVMGLILLSGLLPLVRLSRHWVPLRPHEILAGAFFEPLQALMLVAVGLLAARRHNVLALLAVIGGFMLLFGDSDYLWGSPDRDWPWLPLYMAGAVFLFFVLAPAGLLRARTQAGRAVALFVPAIVFLAARVAVPAIVLGDAARRVFSGETLISSNILLALILGWILYNHLGDTAHEEQPKMPQITA